MLQYTIRPPHPPENWTPALDCGKYLKDYPRKLGELVPEPLRIIHVSPALLYTSKQSMDASSVKRSMMHLPKRVCVCVSVSPAFRYAT